MQEDNNDINQEKLDEFVEKVINDLGATMNSALVFVGDKLGLYKAMSKANSPLTSEVLAKRTETNERYVREWLAAQTCSGYILYDPQANTYSLPAEHALVLADENSPTNLSGLFQHIISAIKTESSVTDAFRTGGGIDWSEHDYDFFEGQERFSRPNYQRNLVDSWIPALDNGLVEDKLKAGGAKVADIGCGYGTSTIIMAKAFPNSTFIGFDYHQPSIEKARKIAAREGLIEDRVRFEVASSTEFPGSEYDLTTLFDCFHDMGDPIAVAKHIRDVLKQIDGVCMIVEFPFSDRLEDNKLNLLARAAYAASVFICLPASLAQKGAAGLGLLPGESKIREIMQAAGFTKFRRSFQSTFNMILEAHP